MNRMHSKIVINLFMCFVLLLTFSIGVVAQAEPDTPTPTELPTLEPATATPLPATLAPTASPRPTVRTATPTPTISSTATITATLTPTVSAESTVTSTQLFSEGVGLELTVYNQNIALVKDRRQITLAAGINMVQFSNIAALIDPSSVLFMSLNDPRGTRVLEQNYVYDLADTQKLIAKYIDQQITLRTVNGEEYSGVLLASNDDIILETNTGIKVIRSSQVQEFTFPQLPSGLVTRPSLNWLITSTIAGPQQVRVTYLTGGLSWTANYIALLSPDNDTLDLNGWVTLQNDSGATFTDARLKLVAGDINLVQQLAPVPARGAMAVAESADSDVQERSFFEYHLYEVQRLVTVRQGETKQIDFIAIPMIPASKVFVYEATPRYYGDGYLLGKDDYSTPGAKIQVRLQFTNVITDGLGMPLPAGIVRVYQQESDGSAEFVGEDTINHTATNESLSLFLGNVFDLVAVRKQVSYRQLSERSAQESWEITLRNHKTESVEVQVIENLFRAEDAEIIESSHELVKISANRARFDISIEPEGEVVLTYTVLYRW